MKFISHALSISMVLALTGCSSLRSSDSSEPLVDAKRLMPDSVLRAGAEVSFSTQQGSLISNFTVACDKPQAWLLFTTRAGDRTYPNSGKRFGDRSQLKEETARQLKAIPAVQEACGSAPDWREVAHNGDIATLIDINSVKNEDGEVSFWGAFDYPDIGLDPPYQAPFSQKFERFRLSCKEQTYAQLSGYDIDQRDRVTDGIVFARPSRERIDSNTNSDYQGLFAAICNAPVNLSTLPMFVAREKTPWVTSLPKEPIAGVMRAIAQLEIPAAKKTLKRLVLEGTETFEGKTTPSHQNHTFRSSVKHGLFAKSETGSGFATSDLSFLGLFNVTGETLFTDSNRKSESVVTEAVFSGDWRQMPPGAELSFSLASKYLSAFSGTDRSLKYTTQCKVIAESEASQLHTALTGVAKQLECRNVDDKYKQVQTLYFLQDYGYVVRLASSKTPFWYFSRKITEVEQ